MRLPFLGRSWCLLATCSLTGCATFDGPFSHQTAQLNRQDQEAQRQIEEANRMAKAGDIAGAKRIIDRMGNEPRGPKSGHASLRGTDYESGESASGSRYADRELDEMIEELVREDAPGTRDLRRKQYRSMSPSLIRKIHREHLSINSPDQSKADQEVAKNETSTRALSNDEPTAPDPRHSEITAPARLPLPKPISQDTVDQTSPSIVPAVHFMAEAPKSVAQPSNIVLAGGFPANGGVSLSGIEPLNQPVPTAAPSPVITPNKFDGPVITPGRPSQSQPILSTSPKAPSGNNQVVPTHGTVGPNPVEALSRMLAPESPSRTNPNPLFPLANEPGHSAPIPQPQNQPQSTAGLEQPAPTHPTSSQSNLNLPAPQPAANDTQKKTKPSVLSAAGVQNLVTSPLRGGIRAFGASDTPAPTNSSPVTNGDINGLITSLETQLVSVAPGATEAEKLEYVHKHVNLRLLYLIAGRHDQALEPIRNIEQSEQEFWQKFVWAISNYFDVQGMPHGADRATQTVTQLRAATQELKQVADLELRNLVFCDKIDAYGSYERTKRSTFAAGLNVLLYAEIDNFKSIAAQGDRYVTSLKSTVEFYKNQGDRRQLASIPFDTNQDFCRNKRRDYFLAYEFTIPQQLEPGTYTLVLRVEDVHGQKQATAKVNFVIE